MLISLLLSLVLVVKVKSQYGTELNVLQSQITSQVISVEDGAIYTTAKNDEYASLTYAQYIHPSAIIYPINANEIVTIVLFAKQYNYSIVIRSGGHQYSGLNSCFDTNLGHKCIQIDMSNFNSKYYNNNGNNLIIGVGNTLTDIYNFIANNIYSNYVIPIGLCSSVGFGGHGQTGGIGYLLHNYGAAVDYVKSFSIVLANGSYVTINQNNYKDLYWAVLGGGPGNWGIITQYEFNTIYNNNLVLTITYIYSFSKSVFKQIGQKWTNYYQNCNNNHPNITLFFIVFPNSNFDGYDIIVSGIWTGSITSGYNFVSDFFDDINGVPAFTSVTENSLIDALNFLVIPAAPEYTSYATHAEHSLQDYPDSNLWNIMANQMYTLINQYTPTDLMLEFFIFPMIGAIKTNDPNQLKNAFLLRDSNFEVFFEIDYTNNNVQTVAQNWIDQTWIKMRRYFVNHRMYYGDTGNEMWSNNGNVWRYFYSNRQLYDKLRRIKTKVDPTNLFKFQFSLPLLSSS